MGIASAPRATAGMPLGSHVAPQLGQSAQFSLDYLRLPVGLGWGGVT